MVNFLSAPLYRSAPSNESSERAAAIRTCQIVSHRLPLNCWPRIVARTKQTEILLVPKGGHLINAMDPAIVRFLLWLLFSFLK